MKCLLCNNRCTKYINKFNTTFLCNDCTIDDMSKYMVTFSKSPVRLISRTLWLNEFYVQLDYINKCTVISKIVGCFLCDTVQINKLIPLDTTNPYSMTNKIKTFIILS